jgi:hypothetical protein
MLARFNSVPGHHHSKNLAASSLLVLAPIGSTILVDQGMADYRLVADPRIGATRERRGTVRLVSVRAASNRAASAAKGGVGPFQCN